MHSHSTRRPPVSQRVGGFGAGMPKRSGGAAVADEEEGGARRAMRKEATAGKTVKTDPQWDGLLESNHTASPTKSAIKPKRDEEAAGMKLSALKQKMMSSQVRGQAPPVHTCRRSGCRWNGNGGGLDTAGSHRRGPVEGRERWLSKRQVEVLSGGAYVAGEHCRGHCACPRRELPAEAGC